VTLPVIGTNPNRRAREAKHIDAASRSWRFDTGALHALVFNEPIRQHVSWQAWLPTAPD
jgi:hypothetical protein